MRWGSSGMLVRFGVFAPAPIPWLAVTAIMLHGICYAFFFATVYIFVDEFFPKDVRSSAQGLFNFLILGFGPFIANFVWPYLGGMFIEPVPVEQASANVVMVDHEHLNLTIAGKADPKAKVVLTYDDGRGRVLTTDPTEADADGQWKVTTQFISHDGVPAY